MLLKKAQEVLLRLTENGAHISKPVIATKVVKISQLIINPHDLCACERGFTGYLMGVCVRVC